MFSYIRGSIEKFKETKEKSALKRFVIYASKFSLVSEMIYSAFSTDPEDLFYKPLDHPDWKLIFDNYSFYEPVNQTKFFEQYKGVYEFIAYGSAFMSKGKSESKFKSVLKTMNWAVLYLIFKKKRMEQFDFFMSNPDVDTALKFYNLPDTDFMQKLTAVMLPKVKVNQIIYVPMTEDPLTNEKMDELRLDPDIGAKHFKSVFEED